MDAKVKHKDNVDMSFVAGEPPKAEEKKVEANKVFEKEGTKIYEERKDGMTVFFDADGKELPASTVENLATGYPPIPSVDDSGAEADGELKVRYLKYEKQVPKEAKDPILKGVECAEADCDVIEHRQYYKNGNATIQTIPKRMFKVVKFLRGEYENA